MSAYRSRPFQGSADLHLLIQFAREICRARRGINAYWRPGDITWQFYCAHPHDTDLRMWFDEEGLADFGAFEPPLVVAFDVRPGIRLEASLVDEILSWAEQRRAAVAHPTEGVPIAYSALGSGISTLVMDSDSERIAMLEARGYRQHEQGGVRFAQKLAGGFEPDLPAGMRLRSPGADDIAGRAELHRSAWSVWGPSTFSEDAYRTLRESPLYDPELDVILETDEGTMVSYCVCWADRELGKGHFEPVGTRPEFAGQGFGRLVIREGLRRLQARGLHHAYVGTASINVAAQRLYTAAGFEICGLEHYYSRPGADGG